MNEWISVFLRESNGLPVFPREMLFLGSEAKKRVTVNDIMDFIKFMETFDIDCYTSVFSQWQQVNSVYDTILLDIDGKDLEESYGKFMKVREMLDIEGRFICSGKGMHFYVDYRPMFFKNFSEVVRDWIKKNKIEELVDVPISIDTRRVVRVPYSINSKVNTFAIPIDGEKGLGEIIKMSNLGWGTSINPIVWNDGVREELERLDGQAREMGRGKIKGTNYFNEKSSVSEFPPCIREIMKDATKTGNMKNIGRMILGMFLVKVWEYDRIIQFFSHTSNYNERKTFFQINNMLEKDYNIYSCDNISIMSKYCKYKDDFEKCPFYPNITRFC